MVRFQVVQVRAVQAWAARGRVALHPAPVAWAHQAQVLQALVVQARAGRVRPVGDRARWGPARAVR
ncbi:hypothetical protein AFR_11155 [Actinoplanes friuliensis DSM 7358]|uniref:Uncharacterized protein n=1 Tax=Actinoplanes friuliensis DSM 7358 TaxID=1246995 RepID=U5VXQ8_9ACTN|nr:hypothetical protein AFR_11155 [Actinoplanes friuliensis DSM 7358]